MPLKGFNKNKIFKQIRRIKFWDSMIRWKLVCWIDESEAKKKYIMFPLQWLGFVWCLLQKEKNSDWKIGIQMCVRWRCEKNESIAQLHNNSWVNFLIISRFCCVIQTKSWTFCLTIVCRIQIDSYFIDRPISRSAERYEQKKTIIKCKFNIINTDVKYILSSPYISSFGFGCFCYMATFYSVL